MFFSLILTLYIIIAISIVIGVVLNGAKPSKTLAWLLAIFTVPIGGIVLYLILGRNRRKNKLHKQQKYTYHKKLQPSANDSITLNDSYRKLMTLVYRNTNFMPTKNNQLKVLKDGKTTFESIFDALNNAKHQIHLQYYIFEEGELANRLLQLCTDKIANGVKIRMIYDGVGSFSLSTSYLKKLKAIGVEVYSFLPFKFGRFLQSVNYRNHRKIIVVDGMIAFTGGINISDKYLKGDSTLGKWHDMHLRIQGDAAVHLNAVFASDWYLVCQKVLKPLSKLQKFNGIDTNSLVQIVYGGPDNDFPVLEQVYFTMINSAKDYLYITNPYIIPSQSILQALQTAALSGVDVRLLISEKTDSKFVAWCVRSYFETLLKSGIKIYLFPDGFLHSKIMVSDDVSTIGTANFDDRSFEQNYEVNAIIYEGSFARLLKEDFLRDCNISRLLSYQEHLKRSTSDKLKEGFGKVFSSLL